MNGNAWCQYTQQPFVGSGSPHLPRSAPPHEEYGCGNSNGVLLPHQDAQSSVPSVVRNGIDPPASSNYDSNFSPKETNEYTLFNTCKENQTELHNFLQFQRSVSRNEGHIFPNADTGNYTGQVPSISYNLDHPSPGPFGVLPHEAVMPRVDRFERGTESFISPVSKTGSYNNGPYLDRDASNVYSTAPLSVQSAFSGDNNASLSPRGNSFSSPSDYYSSPKTSFGAYSNLQSPMPQSPSVAQHSYPSSPYTNVDPNSHISSAPPCSPMNGGSYVNNLNGVPARMGQKTQHSPSTTSNALCYNTSQSQNLTHHGPQSRLPKPIDYHADYGVYPPDQNSSAYASSSYPPIHSGHMSNGNNSRLSQRTHSHPPISHEGRLRYGHSGPVAPSALPLRYEPPPAQSLQPPKYPACSSSMNNCQPISSSMVSSHIGHDRQYRFHSASVVDDKGALDLFNSHVDAGAHNHQDTTNSISNFLDNDLHMLGPETVTARQLRSSRSNTPLQNRPTNYTKSELPGTQTENLNSGYPAGSSKYSYGSGMEQNGLNGMSDNFPKKRGRRGRRRKADINSGYRYRTDPVFNGDHGGYRNGTALPSMDIPEYARSKFYSNRTQRFPSERTLPPFSSLLSTEHDPGEGTSTGIRRSRPRRSFPEPYDQYMVYLEIFHLQENKLHERKRTRKTYKRESAFQEEYVKFIKSRASVSRAVYRHVQVKKEKHKKHHKKKKYQDDQGVMHKMVGNDMLKLKIRLDPDNPHEWYCCNIPASDDADSSSHHVKLENDSEEESNHETGNCSNIKKESGVKKECTDNCNDFKEKRMNSINSKTLPAGKVKVKPEKTSSSINSETPRSPRKKNGRRGKEPSSVYSNSTAEQDAGPFNTNDESEHGPVFIKQEVKEENDTPSENLRTLRSRRNDISMRGSQPGPSVEPELHDLSSDNYENFDDTDSDPAWTPSAKLSKPTDSIKTPGSQPPGRKKDRKRGRQPSANSSPAAKIRKAKTPNKRPAKKPPEKPPKVTVPKKEPAERTSKGKADPSDRFLIAKADINVTTPFIWKVEKKSGMLQRFEVSEHNGVRLYHSSFTYAAGNEICVNNYVTANVRVKSPNTVQYLGPDLSESAALTLSQLTAPVPVPKTPPSRKENFDNLRDDFIVYIQSLLSQDVDSSFFYEIKKFNDEYFLVPIQNLDSITERKLDKLLKVLGNEELKECANTYPCLNILNSDSDLANCQVCEINNGNTILHFSGQPYDQTTLASIETKIVTNTEFNVCDKCSTAVSLFHRLHHYKYNLYIKCHFKASEVKDKHKVECHEDVLMYCLEDEVWIDKMFDELTQIWHAVEENS